jgi:hypothetical protein
MAEVSETRRSLGMKDRKEKKEKCRKINNN